MRLITSLANAAAVLDAWAADRLDAWAENQAPTDAPRETPLGFTPATGTEAPDPVAVVNARAAGGLTGEQRTRWLAEVKGRLDASTGGPWCTEERDTPTGRIYSPYGVIATGVTREADRDLIENARADLYGLLALAEHDDDVIAAWGKAADAQAARRHEAERELEGMEHRLRAVDMVAAAWADGSLKGYRYRVGPDEPAGRVIAAIEGITDSRGKTIRDLQSQVEAMTRADGELGGMHEREAAVDRVLDAVVDGRLKLAEYVDPETPAGRVRDLVDTLLKQVRDAETRADLAERKLDAHHRHDAADADDPFMPAAEATQHAHTIKVALDMYDNGTDPLASLTLHHPLDLSGRVAALASHALQLGKRDATDIDKGGAMYYAGMRDAAALAPEETIEAVKQAAAARIREAADLADQAIAATPVGNDFAEAAVDAAAADAFVAGLRAAADLALDEAPEADPNVAHIDTVNGRADYTPGPFAEAILATGGTIVVDDQGDPHVADIPLGVPTGPGTLITADGKRHRFTGGTASPVNDNENTEGNDDE